MKIQFAKLEGAGNDFVFIDDRDLTFPSDDKKFITKLCNRRFGVGADGVLLLRSVEDADYEIIYFNSDGSTGALCGNGSRAGVVYANSLGLIKDPLKIVFRAVDGLHDAALLSDGRVQIHFADIEDVTQKNGFEYVVIGTTPHHVQKVVNLSTFPLVSEAQKVRDRAHEDGGVNVNYVEVKGKDRAFVRPYERGVEDETLACGTGACAVAAVLAQEHDDDEQKWNIEMPGGLLEVSLKKKGNGYTSVSLTGPAKLVFTGEIDVK